MHLHTPTDARNLWNIPLRWTWEQWYTHIKCHKDWSDHSDVHRKKGHSQTQWQHGYRISLFSFLPPLSQKENRLSLNRLNFQNTLITWDTTCFTTRSSVKNYSPSLIYFDTDLTEKAHPTILLLDVFVAAVMFFLLKSCLTTMWGCNTDTIENTSLRCAQVSWYTYPVS
jgi:hypothetical protein